MITFTIGHSVKLLQLLELTKGRLMYARHNELIIYFA